MTAPRFTPPPSLDPPAEPTSQTDWSRYGVTEIWQMLCHEDGMISVAQILSWQRIEQLCTHQAARLRRAVADLADSWPPDAGSAALTFANVVLTMAHSLDETAASAKANAAALSQLTHGIARTRQEISSLLDELELRERQHAEYQRAQLPWMRIDTGLLAAERARLDQVARDVMQDAEVYPIDAHTQLKVPRRFSGFRIDTEDATEAPGTNRTYRHTSSLLTTHGSGTPARHEGSGNNPTLTGRLGPALPPSAAGRVTRDAPTYSPTPMIGREARPEGEGSATHAVRQPDPPTSHRSPLLPPPTVAPPRSLVSRGGLISGGRVARFRRPKVDPEHQWYVDPGRPAVIEPQTQPVDHSPGPGVIGIDR